MEWILFDKDGTLIEFDHSWEKIGVRFVEQLLETFPVYDKEAALRQLGVINNKINPQSVMGSGSLTQIIEAFNDVTHSDTTDWAKSTSQKLVDNREPEINWVQGVKDAILNLKQQGYKVGIVTSDTKKGVDQFLEYTNSENLFDLIISTEAHAYEKPDARVLAPLFEHYQVEPQQVAIVGDTNNDMQTAVNAKLGLAVGVLTGIATREELDQADVIIDSAKDILDVIK
ncbi:HAD family hydrolase [Staphylococcus simiae]|uniref:HAD family hydrolase n=1 Tax=Staphylococcus simiae TaxID=308354 RepID=UPI001A95E087|nr:HAD family hydrolase [Staphylococcus simiae]MBO1199241.1 HAD family hydrolase [Staphylococcus simiae]MBO1201441.1 HAD family hydrolase [Staphylococcus simiae]MBO1203590.1 HAD family hydrolase [Staphylococcus simiae]MBO1211212.1 HAD family hydrolase [Staphylococcus simiae]MBO1229824.1 HAD family hydrolase [Staphylococcus simiae]